MTIIQNTTRNDVMTGYNQSEAPSLGRSSKNGLGLLTTKTQYHKHFETRLDDSLPAFWCHVSPTDRPIVTAGLLAELTALQRQIQVEFAEASVSGPSPFSYYVFASRVPGVFNLGGDLATFAECVRSGNRDLVRRYAQACVDIVFHNTNALHLPIVTIALVQGDALGGGFEKAMSFDVLIAEKSAKFGLPEILFNLFPGMGAWSFLSRKIGSAKAERLITSGDLYTAEALFDMGVVDVLAEDGQGEYAASEYIRKESRRHSARLAINQARRRVNPVTLSELSDVVDIWTDAVFRLSDVNLRMMDRIAKSQLKRSMARTLDHPVRP